MKSTFKRLLSSVLSVSTLASTMTFAPVLAEDTREDYPYTLFASSDEEGAITIDADNFVINGEIATNGTVIYGDNNSVNTSKKGPADKKLDVRSAQNNVQLRATKESDQDISENTVCE